MTKEKSVILFNKSYKKENPVLLEQYKIISESADKITDKRQNTNNFYLAVNSFLFAISGYLATIKLMKITVLISLIGILISSIWFKNIKSFKNLNVAKFKVIHELEEHLPARIYKKEHEYLKSGYYNLTSIESFIPITFGVLYFGIILALLLNL